MATLTSLLTDTRSHLDEPTAQMWSDAELTTWINEGLREVARRTENLQKTASINTVASTQDYTAPTDALRIRRIEFRQSTSYIIPLEWREWDSMDNVWWTSQETNTGIPYWWTSWGYPGSLTLRFYPIPGSSITNGLKVFYYGLPNVLVNGGDTAQLPNGWEDLIPLYCEFTARRKDNDPRWQEAFKLFEDRLGYLDDVSRHWSDQPSYFTEQGSSIPGWLYGGDW